MALEEVKTFRAHGRFYENEFPEPETLVVVQVNKVDDKCGAYVSLLEYDGREAMINVGELSKKRIRSMLKILRIGSIEVCMVMSVDEDKGYINLSKKRVEPADAPAPMEKFARAKAVHGIMQHVAQKHGIEIEELCNKVSWRLHEKHSSAFEAFKRHSEEEINIWDDIDWSQPGEDLSAKKEELKADIELHMKRRLIASTLRLMAKCEVACHEYEGIDAIKESLQEGFKASKEDCEVHVKLIAHPVFALTTMCRDKELGVSVLDEAMELVKNAIESRKGTFNIISAPQIQKKDEAKEGDDDSEDGDDDDDDKKSYKSESDPEEQDVAMGDLDEDALKELEKLKVDED